MCKFYKFYIYAAVGIIIDLVLNISKTNNVQNTVQGVSFILSLSMAGLWHRKFASACIWHPSRSGTQFKGHHTLYPSYGATAQRGLWPPHSFGFEITDNDAPHSEGLLRTNDQPIAETSLPDNTQHSQQPAVHAPGGIRTHNLCRRAATDLRLRPRDHWERPI